MRATSHVEGGARDRAADGHASGAPSISVIPLSTPDLSGNEATYLQECITSGFVSSIGPFVSRFEAMNAAATGSPEAVATASGTAGLHLALTVVGVRPNDLVMVPSFTFIATANAIAHCGAIPWLVDISPESWTLDSALMAREIAAQTRRERGSLIHRDTGRRVAAILPVHVLGLAADMDAIGALANEYSLKVVADAACAIGATYKGRPIAQMGADLSVLSFNGNKTVTSGGGGAVVGTDKGLLDLARHLSTTARRGLEYDHDMIGFNYRMTNLQAAVGCAQMERLSAFLAAKRRIRMAYDHAFSGIPGLTSFPGHADPGNSFWLSGVVTSDAASAEMLRAKLTDAGIEARPFWKPLHLQAPYRDAPRTVQTVCGSLWRRVVMLPCSAHLSDAQQERVIAAVQDVCARHFAPAAR